MDRYRKDLTGGMPLELNDFEFDENGILDAFAGQLSGIINIIDVPNSVILNGVEVNVLGGNLVVANGWIAYDGEVVKVDPHTITDQGTGATYWFKLVETFDPAGSEVFEDTVTKDTYRVRRMELTNDVVDALPASFMAFDRVNLSAATFRGLLGREAWTVIDLAASTDVKQNDDPFGTGTDDVLSVAPGAGSYLKYNINGKTVSFQFRLLSITLKDTTTFARAIKISALPFTFKNDQFAMYALKGDSTLDLAGVSEMRVNDGGNDLVLNRAQTNFLRATPINFELDYALDTSGTNLLVNASTPATANTWTLEGGATFEIN